MSDAVILRTYAGCGFVYEDSVAFFHEDERKKELTKLLDGDGVSLQDQVRHERDFVVAIHDIDKIIEHANEDCEIFVGEQSHMLRLKNSAQQQKLIEACAAKTGSEWRVETCKGKGGPPDVLFSVTAVSGVVALFSLLFYFAIGSDPGPIKQGGRNAGIKALVAFIDNTFGMSGFLAIAGIAMLVGLVSFLLAFLPWSATVQAHVNPARSPAG